MIPVLSKYFYIYIYQIFIKIYYIFFYRMQPASASYVIILTN